jgi:hypothetical protein
VTYASSAYVSIRQHTSHIPRGLAGSEDFRGHIHHSRRSPRLICCLSTSLACSFRPSRKRLLVLDRLSEVLHHVLALAGIRKVRHLAVALASAYVSIRQHTSAYVTYTGRVRHLGLIIRQHTSAYVSIRHIYSGSPPPWPEVASAYVSIRQHTSEYVSIRQHTSAYVSIRQHTSHAGIRHDEQDVAAAQILVYNRI